MVLSLDDVLLDVRAAEDTIIRRLGGVDAEELALLRGSGEFASPAHVARAARVWVDAGRPRPVPAGGWRVVVNQLGGDPGELEGVFASIWARDGWQTCVVRVTRERLDRLSEVGALAVWSSRPPEAVDAFERLTGFHFAARLIDASPTVDALTALAPRGLFLGGGAEVRAAVQAARWLHHVAPPSDPLAPLEALAERLRQRAA